MSLIIEDLNFSYSNKFGIKHISTKFDNSITAILGPNGSGKSTLMKCLTNLFRWNGTMIYKDRRIAASDKEFFRSRLSYLPQSAQSDSTITVFEAILLGLINSLSFHVTVEQEKAVESIIESLELTELSGHRICELSGGQLQMVSLAQAIVKKPEILILDEPLNNLDVHRQFSLLDQVASLTKNSHMITIIVMHDINLAARYAENILIMNAGEVYSQGSPKEVITRRMLHDIYNIQSEIYTGRFGHQVAEFIGISKESTGCNALNI